MTTPPKCDFCSDPTPTWLYPTADFTIPGGSHASEGAWAACERCHDLIERAAWEPLVQSAAYALMQRNAIPRQFRRETEARIRALHAQWRPHRTGPAAPWQIC